MAVLTSAAEVEIDVRSSALRSMKKVLEEMRKLGTGLVLRRRRENNGEEERQNMQAIREWIADVLAEEDGVGVLVGWLFGLGDVDSDGNEELVMRSNVEFSLCCLGFPVKA
jgi:hypothetical protein